MPADYGPPPPSTPYERGTWLWDGANPAQYGQEWYPNQAEFWTEQEYREYLQGFDHHRQTSQLALGRLAGSDSFPQEITEEDIPTGLFRRQNPQPPRAIERPPIPSQPKPKPVRVKLTPDEIEDRKWQSVLRQRQRFERNWRSNEFKRPPGTKYYYSLTDPSGIEIEYPPMEYDPDPVVEALPTTPLEHSLAHRMSDRWKKLRGIISS